MAVANMMIIIFLLLSSLLLVTTIDPSGFIITIYVLTEMTVALTLIEPELKPADTALDRLANWACVALVDEALVGTVGSLIK